MAKAKNQISKHSRAARRAESPVDKSLLQDASSLPKNKAKAEVSASVLAAQSSGVSKKQKKKRMTYQQRLRQEKAMDRAEAVMDQLEKKVAESKRRGRKVQDRRKEWEQLNGEATKKTSATADEDDMEEDVEMAPAPRSKATSLASINAATVASVGRKPVQRAPQASAEADLVGETIEDEVY